MGKSRGAAENTKKSQGQARKAEAADRKRADEDAKVAAAEDAEWSTGSKGASKKEAEEAKKAEAARKKAEREAMLKEEEEATPSKVKALSKKERTLKKGGAGRGNGSLDDFLGDKATNLNASGIDDAIDALDISTGNGSAKGMERHPERRYKAAYAAYEERRLPLIKEDHPGLRLNQYKELIHKEFEKSPENPFNQVKVDYNATRDDVAAKRKALRDATEQRLAD